MNSQCHESANEYKHRSAATYDDSTRDLELTGVLKGEYPCSNLFIDVLRGTGRADIPDTAVLIDIDIEGHETCSPCQSAELHYEPTVHFNRDPQSARIYHIEKIGTEWKREGPITTTKIR